MTVKPSSLQVCQNSLKRGEGGSGEDKKKRKSFKWMPEKHLTTRGHCHVISKVRRNRFFSFKTTN